MGDCEPHKKYPLVRLSKHTPSNAAALKAFAENANKNDLLDLLDKHSALYDLMMKMTQERDVGSVLELYQSVMTELFKKGHRGFYKYHLDHVNVAMATEGGLFEKTQAKPD